MGVTYLIDTHILLWWLFNDPKLTPECQDIIRNPDNDRMIMAQAELENLPVITYDKAFQTGLIQVIP
jgi:PIN domain nuclease of toxin-antitoxin system